MVFYLLDMDDFKSVNDEYGHAAGDQVLVQIARVLDDAGRASDVVVRWGGEEFLILSRQVDRDGAAVFAQRIRERIRNTAFEVGDGVRIHRTCSVGFATYPLVATRPDWGSWEYVVGLADMAAYMAKRSGRDAWVGFPTGGADLLQTRPTDPEAARGAFEAGALSLSTSLEADGRSVVWSGDA